MEANIKVGVDVFLHQRAALGSGVLPSLRWSGWMGWSSIPFGIRDDPQFTSRLEKGSNDDEWKHLNVSYVNVNAYVKWMCLCDVMCMCM